jgi:hypothetical protein
MTGQQGSVDSNSKGYIWRFFRSGGVDQVRIDRGQDIAALPMLDQKVWVALSCPTTGIEFPSETLAYLDLDKDGRIRPPELIDSINWLKSVLKNLDSLIGRKESLSLSEITTSSDEGKKVSETARLVLSHLQDNKGDSLSVKEVSSARQAIIDARRNGDGVLPPEGVDDETLAELIKDCMTSVGYVVGADGRSGVTADLLEKFFGYGQQYCAWYESGVNGSAKISALGDNTSAAYDVFRRLRPKIDDFFIRAQLAGFFKSDDDSLVVGNTFKARTNDALFDYQSSDIASLPIAVPREGAMLPIDEGVNPLWVANLRWFHDVVIVPFLGRRASLSFEDWTKMKGIFAATDAWYDSKAGNEVEEIGYAKLKTYISGNASARLTQLILEDTAVAPHVEALSSLERLLLLNRDLHSFLVNFVSFRGFYTREEKGTFQAGTLYLDGRSCDLCVHVDDADTHAKLATLSHLYLAYCKLTRKGSDATRTIAAAFTGGDGANLMVGRNGIFYDRSGLDWDATVVKIIEQPISIREAFWLPYRRIGRLIEEQINKFAESKDKEVSTQAASGVTSATQAIVGQAPPPAAAPFDVAKFAGIFAAIGLAVGALGTAIASVLTGFLALRWWQMPLALVGLSLVISGPSMIIAWMKLRKRNLAPLLDACGWAINTKAQMNLSLGYTLTGLAKLPQNAERSLVDPYAQKKTPWKFYLFLVVLTGIIGAALYLQFVAHVDLMGLMKNSSSPISVPPITPAS